MKKTTLEKFPTFQSDEEITAFMEEHDGFELVDVGLAEIIPMPYFDRYERGHSCPPAILI